MTAAGADGAARALWITLALLAALRIALAFVPSMWPWGVNLLRFIPPAAAAPLALIPALALVPALSRPLAPWATRLGGAFAHRAAPVSAFAFGAALAWVFLERLWFTGDGMVRADAFETRQGFLALFPQAMPGDQWLHDTLPRLIHQGGGPAMATIARMLGALEAGTLAVLAVAFTRALQLRGAAALAAAALVVCGGYATLFTGYAKPAGEMALLSAAVGVFGLRLLRQGRGAMGLGLALALGLALHRSALIALPAATVTLIGFLHMHRASRPWRRWPVLAGIALPLIALAMFGPRLVHVVAGFDRAHHFAADDGLSPLRRFYEALNAVAVLSPLALALPALALADRGGAWRSREGLALLPLTLVSAATLIVVRPQQGLFRDWDVFSGAGVAFSLAIAWWVGRVLRDAPRHAWLAVPLALGVAAPVLGWLIHDHDPYRGLERARAFVTEAPLRSKNERVAIWDFIGIRSLRLQRWDDTADAFAHAAALAPSPRLLSQWGLAENNLVHLDKAQSLYRRAVERDSTYSAAWWLLATVSLRMGDTLEARRAATTLDRLDPGNATAHDVLARLDALGEGAR